MPNTALPLRIATGGIQHETNTFAITLTTWDDFTRDSGCGPELSGGDTVIQRYRHTGTIHGGYIDATEAASAELLPLLCAKAQPSGRVTTAAFDKLLGLLLERLRAVMPVDGVALDLHGAMVADEHEDAEGQIIAKVREVVGDDVPIVVTLDYHANITQRMADLANVIIGFDTYPHVDMRERGREAVELLVRIIRGEVRPVQVFRQLPMITLPPKQCTLREPMQSLMQGVHELERNPGLLTATVAMGFPFADIRDAGVSVLATADGDRAVAQNTVDELARRLWNIRHELQPELVTIEAAMRHARENPGVVIFADGSDNPGGGAPCDGTIALQAMIDAEFDGGVVGVMYDPETVAQAHAAGVGCEVDAVIGGKVDDRHGAPVVARAHVRALTDGRFVHRGPMMQDLRGEMGRTAVLVVGGVEIVVSEYRRQTVDAEMLRSVGITPEHRRLIVVKSAVHFRADFGRLATTIFDADTPGIHRPDFSNYDYRHVRRPIFPLDENVAFS